MNSQIFPVGLGGNPFGWTCDEETSFAVLDAFVAAGGNFVDTADAYSSWVEGNRGGESEEIIGRWLRSRGVGDEVVVATKVGKHPELPGLSPNVIEAAASGSLRRLGVDSIDLYFAHGDDPSVPVEEVLGAFDALVAKGMVRRLGLSNYDGVRLAAYLEAAEAGGHAVPVALQPHYNLVARRTFEAELAPVVERHGLAVFPYYSLAAGFLTGKYRTEEDLAGVARGRFAGRYFSAENLAVVEAVSRVADRHGVEPATVAVAWLRTRPGVAAPLAGVSRLDQLPALLAAAHLELTSEDLAELDRASG